jgi:uncharacterized YigZ family protein
MEKTYKTILNTSSWETYIQKSRFIGYSQPLESEEKAQAFIQSIKEKHGDASHNVSAYIIGVNKEIQRYSDDGEPNGTAGIPMINYLKAEDLTNLAVVVTRYFGGIKLGTGGLARAYSGTAKSVVDKSRILEAAIFARLELIFDYSNIGPMENYLNKESIIIVNKEYNETPTFTILILKEMMDQIISELNNLTSGNIEVSVKETKYYLKDGLKVYEIQ